MPTASSFRLGESHRRAVVSPADGARPGSSPRATAPAAPGNDGIQAFPAGPLSDIAQRERSRPSEMLDARTALEVKIFETLRKTEIPEPSLAEVARIDQPEGGYPEPGTEAWLERGLETGVFFPLPLEIDKLFLGMGDCAVPPRRIRAALAGASSLETIADLGGVLDRVLQDQPEELRDDAGRGKAFVLVLVQQHLELNELMRKVAARNPENREKLLEMGRRLSERAAPVTHDNSFNDEALNKAGEDPKSLFGFLYRVMTQSQGRNNPPHREVLEEMNDDSAANATEFARSYGVGGMEILREAAEELELEVWEDGEQAEVEVKLAILEVSQDYGGARMGWSALEREAYDAYTDGIRAHIDSPEGRAMLFERLDQVRRAVWSSDDVDEANRALRARGIELTEEMWAQWKAIQPSGGAPGTNGGSQ